MILKSPLNICLSTTYITKSNPDARAAGRPKAGQAKAGRRPAWAGAQRLSKKAYVSLVVRSHKSVKIKLDLFVTFWIFFAE